MGTLGRLFAVAALAGVFIATGASAASKPTIVFGLYAGSSPEYRVLTQTGANQVSTTWAVDYGDVIFGTYLDYVCCNGDLDPTFLWNTKLERGTVSGSVGASDLEWDHAWSGTFSGRVTKTSGEGVIQMTDSMTGATIKGKWTSEGVDPINSERFAIHINATLNGLPG